MTAEELRTLRAYPRHFDLDGLPVVVASKAATPRAYHGDGRWEAFDSPDILLIQGKLVTAKRFESLCEQMDSFLERGGPFVDAMEV